MSTPPSLARYVRQMRYPPFDAEDVARQLPKAVAAAEKLRRINSEIRIEAVVADVDHTNLVDCPVAAGRAGRTG